MEGLIASGGFPPVGTRAIIEEGSSRPRRIFDRQAMMRSRDLGLFGSQREPRFFFCTTHEIFRLAVIHGILRRSAVVVENAIAQSRRYGDNESPFEAECAVKAFSFPSCEPMR